MRSGISLVLLLVPVILFWQLSSRATEYRVIDTGKDMLCLPSEQKGMFDTTGAFAPTLNGGDTVGSAQSFLVQFDPNTVASAVPGYALTDSGTKTTLYARLTNLGSDQALTTALGGGPYSTGLRLQGEYRHVQKFTDMNAYRVSQLPFPDALSWNVYTLQPSPGRPVPKRLEDYHLGQCIVQTRGERACYQTTSVDGYYVRFELNEINLGLKEELRGFLKSHLDQWKNNCAAQPGI